MESLLVSQGRLGWGNSQTGNFSTRFLNEKGGAPGSLKSSLLRPNVGVEYRLYHIRSTRVGKKVALGEAGSYFSYYFMH